MPDGSQVTDQGPQVARHGLTRASRPELVRAKLSLLTFSALGSSFTTHQSPTLPPSRFSRPLRVPAQLCCRAPHNLTFLAPPPTALFTHIPTTAQHIHLSVIITNGHRRQPTLSVSKVIQLPHLPPINIKSFNHSHPSSLYFSHSISLSFPSPSRSRSRSLQT